METKEELIKVICLHHILLKSKAELDQLKEGLECLGVLDIMARNSSVLSSFFTYSQQDALTAGKHKLNPPFKNNIILFFRFTDQDFWNYKIF